ncbi:Porin [Tritonibacter multivorans]|uniref:Porin n=1 Tax=Tritonibacter multivorans TaxID=928856 RepID=A0A0P1GDA2_9RHOB|nr:porin [Tritonibacter multivorans]MDA7419928.1 porin [Tritonibacter multivorans]CUH79338.1 Porin [Tritonibacter multivorans]SFC11423.1 outer membrane protein OmpU [Tritonibacter multivorans]
MKKILFATTALIATTGMAAAEVKFGGYGRFGVIYDEGVESFEQETRIEQRFRFNITATAETDAGVKLEGRIRLQSDDSAQGSAGGSGPGAAGFAVSTGGLRVDVGHISDTLDSGDVVDYYGKGVGLTSFLEYNAAFGGFDANGFGSDNVARQKVKVKYSVGSLTLSASYAGENKDDPGDADDFVADSYFQIGAGYSFGDNSVGIVYGSRDNDADESYIAASFNGSVGDFSYGVLVGDNSSDVDADDFDVAYGLYGAYSVSSATDITAVFSGGGADGDDDAYGLGFKHGLGGGVSLRGGVGQNTSGNTVADLGVRFDF